PTSNISRLAASRLRRCRATPRVIPPRTCIAVKWPAEEAVSHSSSTEGGAPSISIRVPTVPDNAPMSGLRDLLRRTADRVADYREQVGGRPVAPVVDLERLRAAL